MQLIQEESIKYWGTTNGHKHPSSISTFCPYCDERVTFSLGNALVDTHRKSVSSSSQCPACSETSHFWTLSLSDHQKVFMFPICGDSHAIIFSEDDLPAQLRRAYESTVSSFNSKNYIATATSCRRTLEGVFKFLLPKEKRGLGLAAAIDEFKDSEDLIKPLNQLSHAIRETGNLGAHFDLNQEPDREMAKGMIDLLEYLIEYLYLLPKKIEKLEDMKDNLSNID